MEVIYEDNHLLAVFKPPNIPAQGDISGDPSMRDIAKEWLRKKYKKPGQVFLALVHRLDRPVGGVMILAKTTKAASRLSEQFRSQQVSKTYEAIVDGVPNQDSETLIHYIEKHSKNRSGAYLEPKQGAKRAELSYLRLLTNGNFSLLKIFPKTGRKHQIRAQMASKNLRILGDRKYGCRKKFQLPGIALLATEIELTHPTTKTRLKLRVSRTVKERFEKQLEEIH